MRGFSTPGSANLNGGGAEEGGARAGAGGGGEGRGGGTEGGAPIHQRPSTLAFPPLSFFSTVRAPSFRVTSALFHLSPLEPALLESEPSNIPASNPGPVATLLIAVSKFISGALVGGLPEFSEEGVIRWCVCVRAFVRECARVRRRRGVGGVGLLWSASLCVEVSVVLLLGIIGISGGRCRLSAAINTSNVGG